MNKLRGRPESIEASGTDGGEAKTNRPSEAFGSRKQRLEEVFEARHPIVRSAKDAPRETQASNCNLRMSVEP